MKNIMDLLSETNSNKQSEHRFGFIYDLLITYVYNKKCKGLKLLELGVSEYGNGSLGAFAESDMVELAVGVDIHDYSGKMSDNMRFYRRNAYELDTIKFLEDKYGFFDLIIDDGSHSLQDQTFFLEHYVDLLFDWGVLVCENVNYIQLINEQCCRDDVFLFDGWGNLEIGAKSYNDSRLYQHTCLLYTSPSPRDS